MFTANIARPLLILALTSLLHGCANDAPRDDAERLFADTSFKLDNLEGLTAEIDGDRLNSVPRKIAFEALESLEAGDFGRASTLFNQALMLNPADSQLQFLNGVTYQLLAQSGDASRADLAGQAFELAIKFDASNWMARHQLGLMHLDARRWADAQGAFADALIDRPNDAELLYDLAVASYYNQDPPAAAAVLGRLESIEARTPRVASATAMTMAALGDQQIAEQYFQAYAELNPTPNDLRHLDRRMDDWARYHAYTAQLTERNTSQTPYDPEHVPPEEPVEEDSPNLQPVDETTDLDDRMVIVDVVIIRSEEEITTAKGVNLLNGLQVQYGLTRTEVDGRNETDTTTIDNDGNVTTNRLVSDTLSRTITETIGIPELTYSLNIFNSASFRNEVLARPTLIAMDQEPSAFFSGTNIQAAATANAVAGSFAGGEAININKDIGVQLSVTPEMQSDGRVKIKVAATRTFLEQPSDSVDFQFRIQTSKTDVSANVLMDYGDTLILSGLAEKEIETLRSGVPGLQDIPLLQYFFSEARELELQRSVLILITPRRPAYIYYDTAAARARQTRHRSIDELQARYADWFKPYPNWASIFNNLQESALYREFRTGDVELEQWNSQKDLKGRLDQAIEFLYY